ncbi:MAG: beta-lactamase family protein, partial [Bacteroidales bacterium]
DEPVHPAGEGWAYSDTNYIILGMIIERLMGTGYYDLLKERILEPLSLANTIPADRRELPGLSSGYTGYTGQFGIPEKVSEDGIMVFNPQMEWTGGGLVVTTADLAIWAKRLYEGELFTEETLRMMTTPVPFRAALPDQAKYGMGTFVWEGENGTSYGHSGFMPGYMALMEYLPVYGFSIAIQFNTDHGIKKSLYEYLDTFKEKVVKYLEE